MVKFGLGFTALLKNLPPPPPPPPPKKKKKKKWGVKLNPRKYNK